MSVEPQAAAPVPPEGGGGITVASRLSGYLRGGGVITPFLTALLAFLVGGLVVLLTGHNPLQTYKAIFDGTGLAWIFPWTTGDERVTAALNLQQTLLLTIPLILTGLAVALAFRVGLFNIGGQGQYLVGSFVAVWVGSVWAGLPGWLHIVLAVALAALAGAVWAGIAGLLRATVGANEVISTIMLNWIAVWVGFWAFGLGGPLQNSRDPSLPVSDDVVQSARLHVFWGDPELQGLHIGIFIALVAAVCFWLLISRSTKGYEARAVGFNPDAARYGGINVGRTYVWVMATCGVFAGLAGAMDVLGWEFRVATNDIEISQVGFYGIAVALLGRNTALGTCVAALLFGGLLSGTSVRNLDPAVFPPALGTNLTYVIQGVVVLLVSADVLVVYLWRLRRHLPGRRRTEAPDAAEATP
ncbi:MAG TPA: ABC transporter permease [Solirubrobacteraceae bacterium]|nr:ABC transporter permease [Solirubrobacteraceae bacterium]